MIAKEPKISVWKGWRLKGAEVSGNKWRVITVVNRRISEERHRKAKAFVDTTYEGDLYAAAGARFRLGRESREGFHEPHAGVVYFNYQTHEFLPGTTGKGDDALPDREWY